MTEHVKGRVAFIGGVHEAVPALAALIDADADVVSVTMLPEDRRESVSGWVDLAPLAATRGIPVTHVTDVNAPDQLARFTSLRPDLLVVVGWTRLISTELLAVPRFGCIGFHASLLPHGRGRAPVNWAIIHGEQLTGNTMMLLEPGVDTGDIVDQRPVPIHADDTCREVYDRVAEAGASMLRTHLPALLTGSAPRRPQEHDRATTLPKRTPEMGVTDWSRPARAIHDWIRALTLPYPGAFTSLDGDRVMLWHSAVPVDTTSRGTPGRIVAVDADGISVQAGNGVVVVTHTAEAGGPPVPAAGWARTHGVDAGDVFDAVDPAMARWALGAGDAPISAGSIR